MHTWTSHGCHTVTDRPDGAGLSVLASLILRFPTVTSGSFKMQRSTAMEGNVRFKIKTQRGEERLPALLFQSSSSYLRASGLPRGSSGRVGTCVFPVSTSGVRMIGLHFSQHFRNKHEEELCVCPHAAHHRLNTV